VKSKLKKVLFIIPFVALAFAMTNIVSAASATITDSKTVTVGESVTVNAKVTAGAWNLTLSGNGQSKGLVGQTSTTSNESSSTSITFTPSAAGTYTFSLVGDITDYDTDATSDISKTCTITVNAAATTTNTTNANTTSNGDASNSGNNGSKNNSAVKAASESDSSKNSTSSNSSTQTGNITSEPNITKTETKDTNAYLSSLTTSVGTLEPAFNRSKTDYTLTFAEDFDMSEFDEITINAKAESSKATVSGTGIKGVEDGENLFSIVCTAESGATREYRITFTKLNILEQSDLRLSDLRVNRIRESDGKYVLSKLKETFDPDVFEYTMDVDEDTKGLEVVADVEKEGIIVEVQGADELKPGENIVLIKLTAEDDESVTTTYTIKVNRAEAEKVEEEPEVAGFDLMTIVYIILGLILLLAIILIILIIINRKKNREARSYAGNAVGYDADLGLDSDRMINATEPTTYDDADNDENEYSNNDDSVAYVNGSEDTGAGSDVDANANENWGDSNSNSYDDIGKNNNENADNAEVDPDDQFAESGYNTLHQEINEQSMIDDTTLPDGTVAEHMLKASMDKEAAELEERYKKDADAEVPSDYKRKRSRGKRFK